LTKFLSRSSCLIIENILLNIGLSSITINFSVSDLNSGRQSLVGNGPNTNLVAFGGATPGPGTQVTLTESWNGTSWTEVNDLNTARRDAANCIGTDSTSALCAGGATPAYIANVEQWNGSSWAETTDMSRSTGRANQGGAGTTSSGLVFGGVGPSYSNLTEEWTGAGSPQVRTITTD